MIECDLAALRQDAFDFKKVHGGLLVQERDARVLRSDEIRVVSRKKPTEAQIRAMFFGWTVIKYIRSNAIVLTKGTQTIGIGCGQTSRIESIRNAINQAGTKATGAIMVSDAFLPKTDNVQLAAQAGIAAIIQTGGSIADGDVIKAADQHKLAMVMTGVRHFKH